MTIEQKNRIVDEACRALTDLEKACHILNYWQNEYLFNKTQTPAQRCLWERDRQ